MKNDARVGAIASIVPRGNGARAEGQPGSASSKRRGDHMTVSIDQAFLGHRPVTQCLRSHFHTHFPFPFTVILVFLFFFLSFLFGLFAPSLPHIHFHTPKLPPIQLPPPSHHFIYSTLTSSLLDCNPRLFSPLDYSLLRFFLMVLFSPSLCLLSLYTFLFLSFVFRISYPSSL